MIEPLFVAVGGALGATARHAVAESLQGGRFPVATLAVNVAGSLALGFFVGASSGVHLFAAAGFCGAVTTYSSFSFESLELWRDGERGLAAAYAGANLALSVAGVAAGVTLA
ncbi:MAG: fluoride efflux transporter FluC [Halobacteriota archaeon]